MRYLYRTYRAFCAHNQARYFSQHQRYSSTTTPSNTGDKIVIPKRIQRSPTDILYALSATVGSDPTAAHYKYHDDPYLIPYSNSNKRSFALAQEAGRYVSMTVSIAGFVSSNPFSISRKAAKWIRQEHSDLFQVRIKLVVLSVPLAIKSSRYSIPCSTNMPIHRFLHSYRQWCTPKRVK